MFRISRPLSCYKLRHATDALKYNNIHVLYYIMVPIVSLFRTLYAQSYINKKRFLESSPLQLEMSLQTGT